MAKVYDKKKRILVYSSFTWWLS